MYQHPGVQNNTEYLVPEQQISIVGDCVIYMLFLFDMFGKCKCIMDFSFYFCIYKPYT